MASMIRSFIFLSFTILQLDGIAQAPHLPILKGWTTEEFKIPIEFAPTIPFKGEEHLRFAPGWAQPDSEEHWTYCFAWWIEPGTPLTAGQLTTYIAEYYTGLARVNLDAAKQEIAKRYPPQGSFKLISGDKRGDQQFNGAITIFNYITMKQITLNIDVTVTSCEKQQKRAVIFTISPQPRTHRVWKELSSIREGFRCSAEN